MLIVSLLLRKSKVYKIIKMLKFLKSLFITYALLCSSNGSELISRENGYYITGNSCGVKTKLKYLEEIPEDIKANPCSFIPHKKTFSSRLNNHYVRLITKKFHHKKHSFFHSLYQPKATYQISEWLVHSKLLAKLLKLLHIST